MHNDEKIKYLLKKYFRETATKEELSELVLLIKNTDEQSLDSCIKECWENYSSVKHLPDEDSEKILKDILSKNKKPFVSRRLIQTPKIYKYAAIVAGIFIMLGIALSRRQHDNKQSGTQESAGVADVAPGKGGAILTLADGQKIIIDSQLHNNTVLATLNGTKITLKDHSLVYEGENKVSVSAAKYNTLFTPKGRTFRLTLPDGTNVWLNAESSIQYPVSFNKDERTVTVSGEAYFEVAKLLRKDGNGRVPFIVKINAPQLQNRHARVEVLGTHFNVNAYSDEQGIRTTLLEGSVKVYPSDESAATKIKPGFQAYMDKNTIAVNQVNTDNAIAWKNGFFSFHHASLADVLKELSRWYNVTVVYRGQVPDRVFGGKIQKSLYLSQVLNILQMEDVHFKIEDGNKLIVM